MIYQRRTIDSELADLFPELPAIALDGPKAVGKTSTAVRHASAVIALDDPAAREVVTADPSSILTRTRPILVDEWQHVPAVWDVVRRAVDHDPQGRQFLLTGSASPAAGATAHSGAGRITRLRMRPMTLGERGVATPTVSLSDLLQGGRNPLAGESGLGVADYVTHIAASGFPGIARLGDRARRLQLESYLFDVVDRDLPEQGTIVRRPETLMNWLRAYAAATSSTASYTSILDAATPGEANKPARSTVEHHRELLTRLWLLDPVPAWAPAGAKLARLGAAPKHHLADPALALSLLGLAPQALLDGEGTPLGPQAGTMIGRMFESLATLGVRVSAQAAEAKVSHLRTRNGDHEVDLILTRPDGRIVAIEVKLARTVSDGDVRHLHWLQDRLGELLIDAIVLTTGPSAYRRRDGVGVVPLALLGD